MFFVHDLDGMAASGGRPTTPDPRGRKIVVHFIDGEALSGMTLNYSADGPGFFVTPTTREANNLRIFVVREAVRHVVFP